MSLYRIVFFVIMMLAQQGLAQDVHFRSVEVDTGYMFRGLSVVDDGVAWLSGKNGNIGRSEDGGRHWTFNAVKGFERLDFRSLYAFNAREAVIANAGSPAYIMRTTDGGASWKVVYTNKDTNAFFDGADFWNDHDGIAYGDPINGHMLLLRTSDGGKTWKELEDESRPVMEEGEASFAASGTGIRCYGKNKVIISTGGKVSRLFVSNDRGSTWAALTPPMMHGENSAGIFSLAFANDNDGVIAGGDYMRNTLREDHVFYTRDGGKTWNKPNTATGGQRECVEFIGPNVLLASGVTGMDISRDVGVNWVPVEGQKNFAVVRKARNGKLVVAAGKGKLSVVTVK